MRISRFGRALLFGFTLTLVASVPAETQSPEVLLWEATAERVTITRDDWGIAHVYGPTDADAVFGMMYAQAEDDFNRVETNFINSQGRLAEAEGEDEIWRDLRMKMFIDPAEMQALYAESPEWLKALMDAWADGLNYYLHTHPDVTPRVIDYFEPWMALSFSEGSIGGDIERVDLDDLAAFYGEESAVEPPASGDGPPPEPTGSNGIAIAPNLTENGDALLLINPHTSFFFRSEIHVRSDEGLNAYGAVTWGQFFVYQGFNERAGWMHTSSSVDNIDEYLETVFERDGALYYQWGDEERPVTTRTVTVSYRTATGMAEREFTVYRTHHGPIVRERDGQWVSVAMMEEPLGALQQSYLRTKASDLATYLETMEGHTNSSNNTLFADADGNIAYLHSNYVPVRDTRFDWSEPVDGSDPATDWQGVHAFDASPNAVNPPNGWAQNTNNWPYSSAGAESPRLADYPAYMDAGSENPRGLHAMRILEGSSRWTLDGLVEAAYNSYLTAFERLVPVLLSDYDALAASDPRRALLAEPIELLRGWDLRWGTESVETAVAVFWGEALGRRVGGADWRADAPTFNAMASGAATGERLAAMGTALERLEADFGSWQTPWGEINRFQRLTGDIDHPFSDDGPSIPVGFASGRWGSLASFGARAREGTKRWYGTSGNSFVAVVEFGDRVKARAVTAGGESGDPASPHFNDQAELYATGDLRPVYFWADELEGHVEREYRPGG